MSLPQALTVSFKCLYVTHESPDGCVIYELSALRTAPHNQLFVAARAVSAVVIRSPKGKLKPPLYARGEKQTWKRDSCCILGLPSHPVGWSRSPKGHTVKHLDPKALWGAWGGGEFKYSAWTGA